MIPKLLPWQPERYHGQTHRRRYFEGWYFKLVDHSQEHAWAIIPGVFLGDGADQAHCFVQTLNGQTGATAYHRYALDAFSADSRAFDIQIGPNRFSLEGIALDLPAPSTIKGQLRFGPTTPWPVRLLSPGTMGWYAFVPFMECYHGVLSFDHELQGALHIGSTPTDFSGGRGYVEKDWGRSFPQAWVWMQSNHFRLDENDLPCDASLMASVAVIPWLGGAFKGLVIGLRHDGHLYRFATYTGARVEYLEIDDHQVRLHVASAPRSPSRPLYRLHIRAERSGGGLLHGPSPSAMLQRVLETLTATIHLRLTRTDGAHEQVLLEATGQRAGLEASGELAALVTA